jgi:enolase-phosphatase E1
LATAGAKRNAEVIGLPGEEILFLSDHSDELDAAVTARSAVHGVARAGEPNFPRPPHHWVNSCTEVDRRQP